MNSTLDPSRATVLLGKSMINKRFNYPQFNTCMVLLSFFEFKYSAVSKINTEILFTDVFTPIKINLYSGFGQMVSAAIA